MSEGSEMVEMGGEVFEVRRPQIKMIYREYTNGDGRVTTLGVTARDDGRQSNRILVGTSTGRVVMHNPWGSEEEVGTDYESVVYKDSSARSITSVGGFKRTTNTGQKKVEYFIFIQVRTLGVIILKDITDQPEDHAGLRIYFKEIKVIESDHHGFCPVRAYEKSLYIPTSDKLILVHKNNECDTIRLKSKGSPMCMDLLGESAVVGSEDGFVAIYKPNLSKQDHPFELAVMEQIFDSPIFSLTVYQLTLDVIVGTVGHPIKVLDGRTLEVKQIIPFPASARGCGALSYTGFSPTGQIAKDITKMFIAGFWDGSIRMYRQQKDLSFVEKSAMESQQDGGERRSTTSLVWMIGNELYSACEDGNLYLYEMFKTKKLTRVEKEEYLKKKKASS
ncbi:hypothetical protein PENTCL1PPCAC_2308 [Pristionchus entomophagus]|uniref:Uncharacterized protein n=1 Tax=Pristionchus entomophagus TaxID=358040 RepID=A0AAV5SAY0_9BILA|nr:hypothetical protein PENTCL1PPCAC_2308 [Pristionchus entomophagus]